MATHRTFEPERDWPEIEAFFQAMRTDPMYLRMCRLQRCFRARLTPKPWRMGISEHMKPRPGIWPVNAIRKPERDAWVQRYEKERQAFSACRFMGHVGSMELDAHAESIRQLHDERSGAQSDLPLA